MRKTIATLFIFFTIIGIIFIPWLFYKLWYIIVFYFDIPTKYEMSVASESILSSWSAGIIVIISFAGIVAVLSYMIYGICSIIFKDLWGYYYRKADKIYKFKTLEKKDIKDIDTIYGGMKGALSTMEYETTDTAKIKRFDF